MNNHTKISISSSCPLHTCANPASDNLQPEQRLESKTSVKQNALGTLQSSDNPQPVSQTILFHSRRLCHLMLFTFMLFILAG